jgi:hypothetical protein
VKFILFLLLGLGITCSSRNGKRGGDIAVQREAHSAKVLKLRAAERTVGLAEPIHRVMEAPKTKCMAASVHARLVQQLETDGALQVISFE